MHEGVSAPLCCAFIHRVAFEEVVVKNLPANAGDARDTGLIPGCRGGANAGGVGRGSASGGGGGGLPSCALGGGH